MIQLFSVNDNCTPNFYQKNICKYVEEYIKIEYNGNETPYVMREIPKKIYSCAQDVGLFTG